MVRHPDYRKEVKELLKLALPVFLGQIAQIAISFVDTVIAGRSSALDMAAVAVAASFWIPCIMFGQGLLMAITPLTAQAIGNRHHMQSAQFLHQGIWLALAISLLLISIFLMLSFFLPHWSSMEAELAQKTSAYLNAICWGIPAVMLFNVQRFFLEGHGRTRPAMIVGLLGLILNIPLNIILVFGICVFPAMGAAGCGMATAILYCFMAAAMIWFVQKTDRSALAIVYPRWDIFKRLVRIGTPGAFAILNETAAFALIALMVAPLGVTAVAGHQIAINVSGFIWMCPFSIGAAATIRISVFLGSSRISAARYARLVSLSITLGMAVILAIFTALLRYHVATLYNDDPAVIQMAALLLICEVLYQFPDGIQTNTVCALRGWNDTRAIFWISFLAYWVVSLPLGWTLCMTEILTPEPLGVLGFWISLLFSLSLAAILYLIRIHHLEHLPLETIKKKIDK